MFIYLFNSIVGVSEVKRSKLWMSQLKISKGANKFNYKILYKICKHYDT